jgi:indolepyruvate decarboxylase
MFKLFEQSPIELVGSTSELCAGYAADAYARVNGLAVALVTYGAGGFSMTNATACAYAEKSPVVLVSGAPGLRERKRALKRGELLHHTAAGLETQKEVFGRLTCAHAVLDNPMTAIPEIDRVLAACLRHQRPVYLEIPRDRAELLPSHDQVPPSEKMQSDPQILADAISRAVDMLRSSRNRVLVAGVDIARLRLQRELVGLSETLRIPMAAMALAKGVIPEQHPLYAGIYSAPFGLPEITKFVESSDCVLMLGTMLTDFDTGIFSHKLDDERIILATSHYVRIRDRDYGPIQLRDFLQSLASAQLEPIDRLPPPLDPVYPVWRGPEPGRAVTVQRLLQRINACLDGHTIVLAEPGQSLLAALDLTLPLGAEFLAPAHYLTLGWAVPAAIGAQVGRPGRRPLVLVGDGAFQATGAELGSARRHGLSPIVVIMNNHGYLSERFFVEGKFNDIPDWNYHRMPEYLGAGRGFEVRTELELEAALTAALDDRSTLSVLNVHVERDDWSPGGRRLSKVVAEGK